MKTLSILLAALLIACTANADIVTEFGMGYKLEASTSQILWPACKQVIMPQDTTLPRGAGNTAGCGGDNPAFIGWPVAWEKEFERGIWTTRVGWFHYSNWFDGGNYFRGGDKWETHMDLVAVTATFNWSAWRREHRNR